MSQLVIKRQLIKNTPFKYGKNNKKLFVTVHDTGNREVGADAQAHANLQSNGNSRDASWHWQVDDKMAIQSFDHSFELWHAGDHSTGGKGGRTSIAVEICVNSDGDYVKAVENAAKLVRHILKEENLTVNDVVQHNLWSGKNCPAQIRRGYKGITWEKFIDMVKGSDVSIQKPKPQKPTPKPQSPSKGYTGSSIVEYLKTIGVDSSQANRKKLAKEYGVSNYDFSAKKNLELLDKMRNGSKPKPEPKPQPKPKPKPNKTNSSYTGPSIVEYLKSIGVDSSYSNRKKLAKEYGVKNYSGTAAKNTELLNAMRGSSTPKVSKPTSTPKLRVGAKVKIKSSAKNYSRIKNVKIPSRYKNKNLTIQQIGKDDVLIKELYSWVKKSDLY